MKIKWGSLILGVVIMGLGFGSFLSETFEMSNFGIYLIGLHARVSGLVLATFGGLIFYSGIKK